MALRPPVRISARVWPQGFLRDDQAKVILEREDGQPFTRAEAQQLAASVQAHLEDTERLWRKS